MSRTIYTIGDSHAWHVWLNIPNAIRSISIMTMYDFGHIKQVLVPELKGDYTLCFCLGEVDCRYYINRFPPCKETIDRLVDKYLDTIRINKETHKNIWIYNVPPPPRELPYMKDYGYPLVGSNEERLYYATYMNKKLKESEYTFIDLYNQFCDSEGYMLPEKSDGYVHCADPGPLTEWIKNHDDH